MGLDVSHGCWSGPYGRFDMFRKALTEACGGTWPFEGDWTWDPETVPEDARPGMFALLNHSDCDGTLTPGEAEAVAVFLAWAGPRLGPWAAGRAATFAAGCALAVSLGEPVEFA